MELSVVVVGAEEAIWAEDKRVLKESFPYVPIDWENDLPSEEDRRVLQIARNEFCQDTKRTADLDWFSIEGMLDDCIIEVCEEWGMDLQQDPEIKIMNRGNYHNRIAQLEAAEVKLVGKPIEIREQSQIHFSPLFGKIVVPETHMLVKEEKYDPKRSTAVEIFEETLWDLDTLRYHLCRTLSDVMFRQLRGEWGHGYQHMRQNLDEYQEDSIRLLKDAITTYVCDGLAIARPVLALNVIADKQILFSANRTTLQFYQAVCAYAPNARLIDIAMPDMLLAMPDGSVQTTFYRTHPYHVKKDKRFSKLCKQGNDK